MTRSRARREFSEPRAGCALALAEPIRRAVLDERDVEEAAVVLTTVFTSAEPLSLALGITPADMLPFSRALCEDAARAGLGVVAQDPAGRIVAFSISERWAPARQAPPPPMAPRMAPILALLTTCEARFEAIRDAPGDALHVMVIGALPGYEGKGLTKLLVADNLAIGCEHGLAHAFTEATSHSHHLFTSLGFRTCHEVRYDQFELHDGVRPFASISSVPSVRVMERALPAR